MQASFDATAALGSGRPPAASAGGKTAARTAAAPSATPAPSRATRGSFAELSQIIKDAGLLNQEPVYAVAKLTLNAILFCAGLAGFFLLGASWWTLGIAVYMGFAAGQCIFVWHDAGHQSMFRGKRIGTVVGYVHANLVNGASFGWWVNHHNRHHSHPNHLELDPDISRRTVIFDLSQWPSRRGYKKLVVRYQSVVFFLFLTVEALKMQRTAWQRIRAGELKHPVFESSVILLRAAIYLTSVFYVLTPVQAVCFVLVQQTVQGVYFGMLFAPNHKGMPVRGDAEKLDWLERQVLTSRNIKPSPFMDFLTGGLDYQVEHHLFPTMSQRHLPACYRIVKAYCAEHEIPYREVGFWRSYREVASYLHMVSAPIRKGTVAWNNAG